MRIENTSVACVDDPRCLSMRKDVTSAWQHSISFTRCISRITDALCRISYIPVFWLYIHHDVVYTNSPHGAWRPHYEKEIFFAAILLLGDSIYSTLFGCKRDNYVDTNIPSYYKRFKHHNILTMIYHNYTGVTCNLLLPRRLLDK